MKKIILIAATCILLGGGCATNRTVELSVLRIEADHSPPNGITAATGLEIFRETAEQLGLVVKGPIDEDKDRFFYVTMPGVNSTNRLHLGMFVDATKIKFDTTVYGEAKDFPAALQAAKLFKQALDTRHIAYDARKWVAIPPP